jgi:5-methylcytosine-specific restriction endonuclease McrA
VILKEVLQEIEKGNPTEALEKKRFACAHCGSTWTELVGLVVVHNDGNEELCLRIGMEPDSCQMCRLQARECQKCGSKDVYEISFAKEVPRGVSLSFKGIKTVSRS